MLTATLFSLYALAAILLYWTIGVVASVADTAVRRWMNNHPRWNLDAPVNIKPTLVVMLWVIYLPLCAVLGVRWLFTTGALIAHKLLLEKITRSHA